MLDRDLAYLYRVKARALRQQVKRNIERFPDDFMFQLTKEEAEFVVSQNVTPSFRHFGGHLPYAFTEQGVAMLSGVLHSRRAVIVNIAIMRAFVKLRQILATHKEPVKHNCQPTRLMSAVDFSTVGDIENYDYGVFHDRVKNRFSGLWRTYAGF